MIELSVIFGLYVIGSLILLHKKDQTARAERSELEDRMMALAKPEALILHQAQRDGTPADVGYVGEDIPRPAPTNGEVLYEENE